MIWNSKVPVHHLSANWNKNETSFVGTMDQTFTWHWVFGNRNQPIHIHSCSSPQYNQDFILCLSLDSASTWSISNSGPVLTVVSLLCGHLDEGIRGSLLKSYVWTTPSSLPGKPGFDSWDAASSSCLRLSLLREVSSRRLIFGSFLPTQCYPEMTTGIGTPHAPVSVRVCYFAILLCFCLAKVQEHVMQEYIICKDLTLSCLWWLVCSKCSSWASIMLCFLCFTGRLESIYLSCFHLVLECAVNFLCAKNMSSQDLK